VRSLLPPPLWGRVLFLPPPLWGREIKEPAPPQTISAPDETGLKASSRSTVKIGTLEMNCRVVLVRPQIAANVGAAARVMRNTGLSELVLVEPEADPADPRAVQLATHGEDVLRRCRVVADLGQAVADCGLVAATSARVGGLVRRQFVGPPDEIAPRLVTAMT